MAEKRDPGPDWDWVAERNKCSIAEQFEDLRKLAARDVATRNAQLNAKRFSFFESEDIDVKRTAFVVIDATTGGSPDRVEFRRTDSAIEFLARIRGKPEQAAHVRLTLTDHAGCKFVLGGEVLDLWQLSKRALEPLLFA